MFLGQKRKLSKDDVTLESSSLIFKMGNRLREAWSLGKGWQKALVLGKEKQVEWSVSSGTRHAVHPYTEGIVLAAGSRLTGEQERGRAASGVMLWAILCWVLDTIQPHTPGVMWSQGLTAFKPQDV